MSKTLYLSDKLGKEYRAQVDNGELFYLTDYDVQAFVELENIERIHNLDTNEIED